MRPTYLKMRAFGPYGGEEELDFNSLGETGVYLITGPTGAGKTTIFDAICFALYGKLSSETRSANEFQSDHRQNNMETMVDLMFVVRDQEYEVVRKFNRHKSRDTGQYEFDSSQSVELTLPDQTVISRRKDADNLIREILGLDFDQFTKIVLLAQGQFRKFLEADTAERSKILSNIFDTKMYYAITMRLKDKARELDENRKTSEKIIVSNFENIDCSGIPDSNIEDQIARGVIAAEEILNSLEDIIGADKSILEKLSIEKIEAIKKQNDISKRIGKAETLVEAKANLDKAQAELAVLENQVGQLRIANENEMAKEPERVALSNRIAIATKDLSKYDELELEQKSLEDSKRKLEDNVFASEKASQKIANLESEISESEKKLKEIGNPEAEIQKASNQRETLDRRSSDLGDLVEKCSEHERNIHAHERARDKYLKSSSAFQNAAADRSRIEKTYLDSQAGIIASELSDGEPCPVCGSTQHPHPAVMVDGAPTKAQVDKAKGAEDSAREAANKLSQKVSNLAGTMNASGESLGKLAAKTLDLDWQPSEDFAYGAIDENTCLRISKLAKSSIEDTNAEIDRINKELKNLSNQVALGKKLEKKLETSRASRQDLENEKSSIDSEIAGLKVLIGQQQNTIEDTLSSLEHKNKSEASKAIEDLKRRESQMQKSAKEAADKLAACNMAMSEAKARIAENEKTLSGETPENLEELEKAHEEIKARSASIDSAITKGSSRVANNQRIFDNCSKRVKEHEQLEKQWEIYDKLYRTASGGVTGADKITLETYVQTVFFDQMLAMANRRLSIMSSGRYELRRRMASNGKSKVGLDLDVMDYDTGKQRSASTLSGGEGFLASMALALGVSDVVQNNAGGIGLDCMFIDEGFGSLDEDTLSLAMKTLAQIGSDNKLIGIISHIDELERVISKKIVVEKTHSGSHATIKLD